MVLKVHSGAIVLIWSINDFIVFGLKERIASKVILNLGSPFIKEIWYSLASCYAFSHPLLGKLNGWKKQGTSWLRHHIFFLLSTLEVGLLADF
jgi:hypothetical protein